MPWFSCTSDTVWLFSGTVLETTYSACKRFWTLTCVLFQAVINLTTYQTCGRNFAGSLPGSCTNPSPHSSFTKPALPENHGTYLPGFLLTRDLLGGGVKRPHFFRRVIAPKRHAAGVPNFQYLSQTKRSLRWQSLNKISSIFFRCSVFVTSWYLILPTKNEISVK